MSGKNGTSGERVVDWAVVNEDDREYAYIPVAVWKARARVQTLNAKELTDIIEVGGVNIGFKLIALCVVDKDGRQVFRSQDQPVLDIKDTEAMETAIALVKQKNPKAINELAEALIKMNGITMKTPDAPEPENEIKNDSGVTATDASPSA